MLAWHLFLREKRRRWIVLALVTGVLQIFAGAPEMIACGMLTLFVWTLGTTAWTSADGHRTLRAHLIGWLLLGLAIGALASVQLVPLLELVGQSSRGAGLSFEDFARWSLAPQRLPELVVGGYLGLTDTLADSDYWGVRVVDRGFPYFLSLYLGAIPLFFAVLGARWGAWPRRLRLALGLLAAGSLLLCLGRFLPGFEALYNWVPPLRIFRYPTKLMTLTILPLALLAAAGLDLAVSATDELRRKLYRAALLAWGIAGLPALLVVLLLRSPEWGERVQNVLLNVASPRAAAGLSAALIPTLGIWIVASALLLWPRLRGEVAQGWLLALLAAADLMLAGRGVMPHSAR